MSLHCTQGVVARVTTHFHMMHSSKGYSTSAHDEEELPGVAARVLGYKVLLQGLQHCCMSNQSQDVIARVIHCFLIF
jgi:hypothetical protein